MSQTQVSLSDRAAPGSPRAIRAERLFYPVTAIVIVLLTFIGFSAFYLHGMAYPDREIAPPIKLLVIMHGLVMSGWIVLLAVQPMLILGRRYRAHMALGRVGAVLAGLILVLGLWVAVRSAAVTPPEALIWGLPPLQFMAVPFISVLVFAAFVALGVMYRRKPAVHRSMMLLATLAILSAAVSRIDPLNNLYLGTVWERLFGPFFVTLAFGVVLLGGRWAVTRTLDRVLAIGLVVLVAISLGTMQLARTVAWEKFAATLAG